MSISEMAHGSTMHFFVYECTGIVHHNDTVVLT